MGTVTLQVGSSRTYTTIAAAIAALPSNLVTNGNSYVLELYNDSEFSVAGQVALFTGITTDATHTITMKCAAGHSFMDHANKLTNRLAYNQSNGVAIKCTGSLTLAIDIEIGYVYLEGLQIKCTSTTGKPVGGNNWANGSIKNCLLHASPDAPGFTLSLPAGTVSAINCLIIHDTSDTGSGGAVSISSAAKLVNCTIVRPSNRTSGGSGVKSSYGAAVVKNCMFFGFGAPATGTGGSYAADGHNVTDYTSAPGSTSNLVSKTYANQFQQSSTASNVEDFRLKSTSDALDVAATDSTNVPAQNDIVGTARPQGSAWDIGAWEYQASGTTISGTIGNAVAAGSSAAVGNYINGLVGNAVANGSTASVSSATSIAGLVGNAVAAGPTATPQNFITTQPFINNSESFQASVAVNFTWLPAGRFGSLTGITPTEGSGTTGSDGKFVSTISHITSGPGILLVAHRVTDATDDDVYYEAFA